MVERERALGERRGREAHQPEPVVGALADEIVRGLPGDRQAVPRVKILGHHAGRDVDREHDVHAASLDLAEPEPLLGARDRGNREHDRDPRQYDEAAHQPGAEPAAPFLAPHP